MSEPEIGITRRELLLAATAFAARAQTRPAGKVRIGVIGAGHRAWAHLAVLRAIPEFAIAGIADPTPEFLRRAADVAGPSVALYSDYRRLLSESQALDAAVVVSPNCMHAEQSIACFERGLHVLCEKPMAIALPDADRMMAAAQTAGKVLQISLQLRCTPLYEALVGAIHAGEIGAVRFVSCQLFRGDWNPESWRVADSPGKTPVIWRHLARYAGGSLLEDGIHEIDLVNWALGARIRRVYASGGNAVWTDRETIDHASVIAEYEGGAKLQLGFSLFAAPAGSPGRTWTFIGTEGVLHVEASAATLRKRGAEPRQLPVAAEAPEGLFHQQIGTDLDIGTYRQALGFLDSIRTGRKPVGDGRAGREAVRCSLLAERSVREQRVLE